MQRLTTTIICFLLVITSTGAAQTGHAQSPQLEEHVVIATDHYRLPLSKWLPDGEPCRVVLGLHGFNDYRETFDNLASALSRDCTAFYAYDQRGFGGTETRGQWPGRTRLVNDAVMVANLLRKRYPEKTFYVIGESMGGAVALLALAQDMPVDGAILMAPAVWARDLQPWYQHFSLWLSVRLMPNAKLSSEWIDIDPSDDPAVLEYWRSHPMVIQKTRVASLYGVNILMDAALQAAENLDTPSLILYGGEDEVIPSDATCALLRKLHYAPADWRFVYYPEGYHMLARYSGAEATIEDIRAWLMSADAELPSGRELEPVQVSDHLCGG